MTQTIFFFVLVISEQKKMNQNAQTFPAQTNQSFGNGQSSRDLYLFQQKQWQRDYWEQYILFGDTWRKYFYRVWWRYTFSTYRQKLTLWFRSRTIRFEPFCPECYIPRSPGSSEPKICVRLFYNSVCSDLCFGLIAELFSWIFLILNQAVV